MVSVVCALADPERIKYPLTDGLLLIAVFKALAIEFALVDVYVPARAVTIEDPYFCVEIKARNYDVISAEPTVLP